MKENNVEVVGNAEAVNGADVQLVNDQNVIELRKPIGDGDKKITRLYFDFDALTGRDILAADADLSMYLTPQEKAMILLKDSNYAYQMAIAARACGLTYDVIMKVGAKDAIKISRIAQSFLLTGE